MKNILFFFLIFSSLFFTSCLELTEEINMNNDGSGSAIITLNLNESKDNLNNYFTQGEFQGQKLPSKTEILGELSDIEGIIEGVKGISNVSSNFDMDEYIFKFSGDFTNVDVLNDAVNILAKEMSKKNPVARTPVIKDNFSFQNGKFSRLFDYPIDKELYNQLGFMEQFFLESSRLVGIYRFPNAIKNQSNEKANVSSSKKAVMLKTNFAEIMKGETSIANEIDY